MRLSLLITRSSIWPSKPSSLTGVWSMVPWLDAGPAWFWFAFLEFSLQFARHFLSLRRTFCSRGEPPWSVWRIHWVGVRRLAAGIPWKASAPADILVLGSWKPEDPSPLRMRFSWSAAMTLRSLAPGRAFRTRCTPTASGCRTRSSWTDPSPWNRCKFWNTVLASAGKTRSEVFARTRTVQMRRTGDYGTARGHPRNCRIRRRTGHARGCTGRDRHRRSGRSGSGPHHLHNHLQEAKTVKAHVDLNLKRQKASSTQKYKALCSSRD